MEKIYRDLTGVDINEQKRIWDERGRGYYGEYLVMQKLYQQIPGTCKILMNLNIPVSNGRTTEIDLLMIHETGLYVFEIKHYKGDIYGKTHDEKWTQYFRTAPNHSFLNPVKQNEYHISGLKKLYPDIPIYSMVIFTNNECKLHIEGTAPNITICTLNHLIGNFLETYLPKKHIYSTEQIDTIFNQLLVYAPEHKLSVAAEGEIRPFYEYIGTIVKRFKADSEKIKAEGEKVKADAAQSITSTQTQAKKSIKRAKFLCLACVLGFAVICAAVCGSMSSKCSEQIAIAEQTASDQIAAAEKRMTDFAKKFEHVEELRTEDMVFSSELVSISDLALAESKELEDTVTFSCYLTCTSQNYKILIGKDCMLNVILSDGSVKEYDLWNKKYPYHYDIPLGRGDIAPHDFYNVKLSEISYIKLTNLRIGRVNTYPTEILTEEFEIELYDSTK